jgi:hypothetical protein
MGMSGSAGSDEGLRSYLRLLTGGAPPAHFLELRYRVGEAQLVNEFHPAHATELVAEAIRRRASRTDVYVGCAPRRRRSGTKDAIEEVWTLWAECDGDDCVRKLHAFRPRPALIVASGSGVNSHAYWPLSSPLPPEQAEVANLRLAEALGADHACFDAGRILRPPGTWNFKHRPPRPVALLALRSELQYDASDVVGHLPSIDEQHVRRRWHSPDREGRGDALLSIEPSVYVADLLGQRPGRNRKVRCPFHHDERPSLHVYETGLRGWCCFSCRRGGTIYDLAAAVWGVETRGRAFVELRRRLLDRYQPELALHRGTTNELER